MPSPRTHTGYDVLYRATLGEACHWSPVRLTIALTLMLQKSPGDEARWGAIDALTDLLGGIAPPARR